MNTTAQSIASAQIPKHQPGYNHYPQYQPRTRQQKLSPEAAVDMAALFNKASGYQVPGSASKQGSRKGRMLQGPKLSNQLSSSIPEEP